MLVGFGLRVASVRRVGARALSVHHPKLAVEEVPSSAPHQVYRLPKEALNVVFKPGAFGGQIMAAALHGAIKSAESRESTSGMLVSSQMSSFLGPTLVESDVYFRVSTVRDSGKTFSTKRVEAYQQNSGDDDVLFESTIAFYRPPVPPVQQEDEDASPTSRTPPECLRLMGTVEGASASLDDLLRRIKSGEIRRGKLYTTAVKLALSLAEADMLVSIRMPHDDDHAVGSGRSCYFVGVDECLLSGMSTTNLARVILPYVSDGMTQPLACTDPLDKTWDAWPRKITVWNYGCWFENNTGAAPAPSQSADGKKWFLVEYSVSGAVGGLGNGQTKIWCCDSKKLLMTSAFQILCLR